MNESAQGASLVITGGAGFLGQMLARALLDHATLPDANDVERKIERIVLLDRAQGALKDPRVVYVEGDVADAALLNSVIDASVIGVVHLAAVVSGTAEADFDLGMRVNLDGTRALLEVCRTAPHPIRVLFASSVAVFGGKLPAVMSDDTAPVPQSSYGVQKLMGELLVGEYGRKGFVDGRAVRIPTVSVRPGLPNGAASSFASGIVREPLAGVPAVCPVEPETEMWLASPRAVIAALQRAYRLPRAQWTDRRALNLPGITVKAGDIVDTLRRLAGDTVADRVTWEADARIKAIVQSWPARFETARADALGFERDAGVEALVGGYIKDFAS